MSTGAGEVRGQPSVASLLAGTVAALVFGLWGVHAILAGAGPIVVFATFASDGWRALGTVSLAWVLLASMLRERWIAVAVTRGAALILVASMTASNVGRAMGLVGMTSVMVAHAALVHWEPGPRWPTRPRQIAWVALGPLAAAQVAWARSGQEWVCLVLLGLTIGVVELHHRSTMFEGFYDRVGAVLDSVGAALGGWRSSTGTTVARVPARVAGQLRVGGSWAWAAMRDHRAVVMTALATGVLMAPVWYRYASQPASVVNTTDYETHLYVASELSLVPLRIPAPHIGFHVFVAAMSPLVGAAWATTITLSLATAFTTVMVVAICRRPFAERVGLPLVGSLAIAALYLVMESPLLVARWRGAGSPYDWATVVHAFDSPTDTFGLPFSLLLLVLIGGSIADATRRTTADGWKLTLVTIAATVAKPSWAIALLPVLPLYLGLSRRRTSDLTVFLAKWFVLPAVTLLIGQTLLLEVGTAELAASGIALEPLATYRLIELDRSFRLLAVSLLVIPLSAWVGVRRYLGEPMVALSLLALVGGVGVLLLFRETGARSEDGTFAKPALMAAALVYVVSWRFLLGEAWTAWGERGTRRLPVWFGVVGVLAAVSLMGGVLGYLDAVGAIALPVAPSR